MAMTRELRRVGRTLRHMEGADPQTRRNGTPPEIKADDVRAIIAARRLRELCLGPGIGDAAWALLLDAYAARLEGRRIPITDLGMAEEMARSTAYRWARALIERGLLSSHAADGDQRVSLVRLSDEGANRMHAYLIGAAELSPWVC